MDKFLRGENMRALRSDRGFTLVEMLVALTIFSIGMLAILKMFTVSFTALRGVKSLNTATRLAQRTMETLTVDPTKPTTGLTAIVNAAMLEGATIVNSTNPVKLQWPDQDNPSLKYTVTVSVQSYDISGTVTMNMAESRVEWTDLDVPKIINVVTFLPTAQGI